MTRMLLLLVAVFSLTLAGRPVVAHHSEAAEFDSTLVSSRAFPLNTLGAALGATASTLRKPPRRKGSFGALAKADARMREAIGAYIDPELIWAELRDHEALYTAGLEGRPIDVAAPEIEALCRRLESIRTSA